MTNKLSVQQVSISLGKHKILHEIDFEINKGEILTVLGPSGSGKSTLLNILGGIIKNYSGKIEFDNLPIKQIAKGYIPQNLGLLPWKTVKENIYLTEKINKNIKISAEEVTNIIQELEIESLLNRYPTEISGGQKQRVALARLFVSKPELLLMDEPFSALDTFTAENSRKLFLELWKSRKITTIFSTHNLSEAVQLGKKILIISKLPGRILHIIDNPLFEHGASRTDTDFFNFEKELKKILDEERQKGNF